MAAVTGPGVRLGAREVAGRASDIQENRLPRGLLPDVEPEVPGTVVPSGTIYGPSGPGGCRPKERSY
jgi:hypothetical protein